MSDNKLETGMEQLLAWSNMQEELNDIDFSEGFSIDDLPHKEVDKILPECFRQAPNAKSGRICIFFIPKRFCRESSENIKPSV